MEFAGLIKTISIVIGIISGSFAIFFAGWNLSKSKNGYVKKSDCELHKKSIERKNDEQTKTLIMLDRKINQILGYIRASNGQGLEG